ncbi:unnamed protein product [Dovyalis caffra]|uniref:SnoaL-like domain-containing protein n=1 Tax=Dovyalis caffra TaxID=77055 RepID=A0AAV1RHF2_9ROSI|nr:unnamed protein product [Dovyalis caffra]
MLLSSTSQPQVFHSILTRKPISHLHKYRTCLAPPQSHSRMTNCPTSTSRSADIRELNQRIADLYDQSFVTWEDTWGDHMHHSFYDPDEIVFGSDTDHRASQIRMVQEALGFAGSL